MNWSPSNACPKIENGAKNSDGAENDEVSRFGILKSNASATNSKKRFEKTLSVGAILALCVASNGGLTFAQDDVWRVPTPAITSDGYFETAELSSNDAADAPPQIGTIDANASTVANETDANGGVGTGEPTAAPSVSAESIAEFRLMQEQIAKLQAETDALKNTLEAEKSKKKDPNGSFSLSVGGHMIADALFVSQDDENKALLGDVENAYNLRDSRLTLKGSGYGNLEYVCGFMFNNGIRLTDFYLRAKDTGFLGDLTFGHFFVESGMESVTFSFERAYANFDEDAIFFRQLRRLGVGSTHYALDKRARAFFGVYMAKGINKNPVYYAEDAPGVILNGRLTAAPIYYDPDDDKSGNLDVSDRDFEVLHVGASYYWLGAGGKDTSISLSTRGAGWDGDSPYFINGKVGLDGKSYNVSQLEAAWAKKGFAATSELYCSSIEDGGCSYGATVGGRYFLTPGCYRKYSKAAGRFQGFHLPKESYLLNVKERSIGENWGAWEVLGKWDWLEANNLRDISSARYGSVHRTTLGLNWFWNDKTVWMLNWEHAFLNVNDNVKNVASQSGVDSLILQARVKF